MWGTIRSFILEIRYQRLIWNYFLPSVLFKSSLSFTRGHNQCYSICFIKRHFFIRFHYCDSDASYIHFIMLPIYLMVILLKISLSQIIRVISPRSKACMSVEGQGQLSISDGGQVYFGICQRSDIFFPWIFGHKKLLVFHGKHLFNVRQLIKAIFIHLNQYLTRITCHLHAIEVFEEELGLFVKHSTCNCCYICSNTIFLRKIPFLAEL